MSAPREWKQPTPSSFFDSYDRALARAIGIDLQDPAVRVSELEAHLAIVTDIAERNRLAAALWKFRFQTAAVALCLILLAKAISWISSQLH